MPRNRVLMGLVLAAVTAVSALVVILVAWPDGGEERAGRVGTLPAAPTPDPQAPPVSGEPSTSNETPPAISARSVISPRILLFGDTVRAQVDFVLDEERVDPDSVRVAAAFSPWAIVGEPERVQRVAGSLTYLTTTYVLRCLSSSCVPPGQTAQVEFDPARVTYAAPGIDEPRKSLRIDWPVITVYSRFSAASFTGRQELATPWRAEVLEMPAVSYRADPVLVLALLVGGGLLLGAAGIVLVYVAWPRRAPAPPPEPEAPPPPPLLSPLQQALQLLEDAARTDGAEDRRRALELVAEVLDESGGDDDLARSARVLAWSEDAPEVEETTGLAILVRSALELEEAEAEQEANGRVV